MMIGVIPPRAIHSGSDLRVFHLLRFSSLSWQFFWQFSSLSCFFFSISLPFVLFFWHFSFLSCVVFHIWLQEDELTDDR